MSWLDDIPFFGIFFQNWDNWADKWIDRAKWVGVFIVQLILINVVSYF
jgi:hypothetical protein